jgi:hypothetical protein
MLTRTFATLAAAVILRSTVAGAQQRPPATSATTRFNRADFDTTCTACADFYTFANGSWIKRTAVPPSAPQWGPFTELQEPTSVTEFELATAPLVVVTLCAALLPARRAARTRPSVTLRGEQA